MGFDKGTITNATVVTISLLAVVGLLVAGATPAAAQSDDPEFDFDDDGGDFGFTNGDDDSDSDSPEFGFGGGDDTDGPGFGFGDGDDGPGFDFGGGDGAGDPGFDFGGGDDTGGPGFDFGDGEEPGFDFGDDGDEPGFDFGDGDEPDFGSGDGDDGDDEQPNVTFAPTISGTNSPVTAGETLTVDATIENVGTGNGSQTVTLTVGGDVRDSQQVSLSGGESTSVTFAWDTQDGDAGNYTASVNTATQDVQTDVTVESAGPGTPANFQVSNLEAPTEATVGDSITVSADVENTGDQEDTQSVEFGVDTDDDGSIETLASRDETLAGGASTTVTFDVDTSSLSAGTYTHGVSTANDTETAQITLESQQDQPANFQVQSISTNSPVNEGETLTIDATVENTGDQSATQRVSLSVLGVSKTNTVSLAGGENASVTFSVVTLSGDAGKDVAVVETDDDSISTTVRVNAPNAPANFAVSGVNSNSPVNESETLLVNATVQNTGAQQGEQTITLTVGGTQRDSTTQTVASGASQDVQLSWTPASGDAGSYTAEVASANDTGSTSVSVESAETTPATIGGTVTGDDGTALSGAAVVAGSQSTTSAADGSYTLEVSPGTYTVEADADGYQSSSQTVTVAAGGTETVDFALDTESDDGGDGKYNLTGPTDFTGYVLGDDAYLHTGTPDNDRPITYSRCRDGEPDPAEQDPGFLPTNDCITVEGTVFPSNNSWVGDVNFTPVTGIINDTKTDTFANVYFRADFSTVDGARGTFDPTTGETTLDTTVGINVSIWPVGPSIFSFHQPTEYPYSERDLENEATDPTCTIPNVQIEASSEKSFTSGSPFPGVGTTVSGERLNQSLYGKVVTDDFSVGSADGCSEDYFGVNMNEQVDLEQGLPAPAGDNEAVYDIKLELEN